MTDTTTAPKLIIPSLGGLYANIETLAMPLIRVVAGVLLIPHGYAKLFGGMEGTTKFFESQGLEPAYLLALVVGIVEFFGGILLAAGFLTRIVAAAVVIEMIVATFHVHWGNGFLWIKGGYEYPLMWGLVALAFVFAGAGRYSVDRALGKEF